MRPFSSASTTCNALASALFICCTVLLSALVAHGAPVFSPTESKIISYAGAIIDLVLEEAGVDAVGVGDAFRSKRNSESLQGMLQGANFGHMAGIGKRNAESLGDMLQGVDFKRMSAIGKRNAESLQGMLQGANFGHMAGIGKRNAEELTRLLQDPYMGKRWVMFGIGK